MQKARGSEPKREAHRQQIANKKTSQTPLHPSTFSLIHGKLASTNSPPILLGRVQARDCMRVIDKGDLHMLYWYFTDIENATIGTEKSGIDWAVE